jgi:hypothetical protein
MERTCPATLPAAQKAHATGCSRASCMRSPKISKSTVPMQSRSCRIEEPARYVQIVASLMPRELEIEHQTATSDLDDQQLDSLITQIRQQLLTKSETKPMKMIETTHDNVLIERKS